MTDFGKQSSIEEAKTRIESLISDQIRVLQDKMKEFEIQSAVRYKVVHGRHYYGWPEFVTKANGEYWKFGKTDFDENLDLVFLSPDPDKAEIFFAPGQSRTMREAAGIVFRNIDSYFAGTVTVNKKSVDPKILLNWRVNADGNPDAELFINDGSSWGKKCKPWHFPMSPALDASPG